MARSDVRAQMTGLLKPRRASGESAAPFCRRQGIRPQKLSCWKGVLGASGPVRRRARRRSVASLVPVRLVGSGFGTNEQCLEIHSAGGERVVFPEAVRWTSCARWWGCCVNDAAHLARVSGPRPRRAQGVGGGDHPTSPR
jgi:hypothetical protein